MSKLQTVDILCGNEPIVFATGYVLNTKYDSGGKLDTFIVSYDIFEFRCKKMNIMKVI